jgi:hypothetical protein
VIFSPVSKKTKNLSKTSSEDSSISGPKHPM